MSDLIRREDVIAAVDFWQGDWSCTVLALMALPAVQPDAREAVLREVLTAIWRDDLGEEATAMYNQIVALLNTPTEGQQ
jgi:hypothetical protein